MNNPCEFCHKDLGAEPRIVAIGGSLLCVDCATLCYGAAGIDDCGELVVPSDIGIEPTTCYFCSDEFDTDELVHTTVGVLCHHCLRVMRSRGELIEEV